MSHNQAVWIVAVGTLLAGCATIPDYVLEREQQRQQLWLTCATALRGPNPEDEDLAACKQHQTLAMSIMDDFVSRSERGEVNNQEVEVINRTMNHIDWVKIKVCYVDVKRGYQISDNQGRVGIAVCDKQLEERRHRQTLEAIERAQQDANYAALEAGR